MIQESVMEPKFKRGEHVIVDLSDKRPSPPGTFVISDGFGFMARLCSFIPGSSPPEIKVSAFQEGFVPQILSEEDVEIVGRIIGMMQWI